MRSKKFYVCLNCKARSDSLGNFFDNEKCQHECCTIDEVVHVTEEDLAQENHTTETPAEAYSIPPVLGGEG